MQIVMVLVFTSALLVFMIYPAIKIVAYIESKKQISERMYSFLTVLLTIVLALLVGAGLYFL